VCCLSVSVEWLAVKTTYEMIWTVSGGALTLLTARMFCLKKLLNYVKWKNDSCKCRVGNCNWHMKMKDMTPETVTWACTRLADLHLQFIKLLLFMHRVALKWRFERIALLCILGVQFLSHMVIDGIKKAMVIFRLCAAWSRCALFSTIFQSSVVSYSVLFVRHFPVLCFHSPIVFLADSDCVLVSKVIIDTADVCLFWDVLFVMIRHMNSFRLSAILFHFKH